MGARARRILGGTGLGLAALAAVAVAVLTAMSDPVPGLSETSLLHNLREVDPGRLYRSGQLSPRELDEVIDELGIRTVINLRGHRPRFDWYFEQLDVIEANDVEMLNLRLSSRRLPFIHEIETLLHYFEKAERPILMHCRGGSDRAGQASAIYMMEYMERSREEALAMLTPFTRHFTWHKPAMRTFVSAYDGPEWLRSEYAPCAADVPPGIRPDRCPTALARR